jgi:hypothetical protein
LTGETLQEKRFLTAHAMAAVSEQPPFALVFGAGATMLRVTQSSS